MKKWLEHSRNSEVVDIREFYNFLENHLQLTLSANGADPEVAGFKSIVCYRTGMDVSVTGGDESKLRALREIWATYKTTGKVRLAHKALNDEVVRVALRVAGEWGKPGIETYCLVYSGIQQSYSTVPYWTW